MSSPFPPMNTLGYAVADPTTALPMFVDFEGLEAERGGKLYWSMNGPCVPLWPTEEAAGRFRDEFFPECKIIAVAMLPLLTAAKERGRTRERKRDRRRIERSVTEHVLGSDFESHGERRHDE